MAEENTSFNCLVDPIITCNCCICQKEQFFRTANPKIKTTRLAVLILKSLKMLKPEIEYYSLKGDILPYISSHLHLFSNLKIFRGPNFRKSLLDALNHSSLIESGREACHNRGYYRLRQNDKSVQNEDKNAVVREMYSSFQLLEKEMNRSIFLYQLLQEQKQLSHSWSDDSINLEETQYAVESKLTSLKNIEVFKTNLCNCY
ncbi:Homologous-pairing protein 2 winged helix domain-containing protein [Entamoeba marina]